MSEATHIPGPWNCCQESVDPEWWIVTIQGGLVVANVNAHHRQEANARLIAAAPDMLAAAQKSRDLLEVIIDHKLADPSGMVLDALNSLDAAIAKAEGASLKTAE